jgi:hypothetical protein
MTAAAGKVATGKAPERNQTLQGVIWHVRFGPPSFQCGAAWFVFRGWTADAVPHIPDSPAGILESGGGC